MGGLIPDWDQYSDPMNDVNRPAQMAPLWTEASQVTGVNIRPGLWHHDPPASSYPACIAVKCVELQSKSLAVSYLYALRKAVMLEERNISKTSELQSIAREVNDGSMDVKQFDTELIQGSALKSFQEDLEKKEKNKIHRIPTMVMKTRGTGLVIIGYRPPDVLEEIYEHLKTTVSSTEGG